MLDRNKRYFLGVSFILVGIGIFAITAFGFWGLFPKLGYPDQIGPQEGGLAPDFKLFSIKGEQFRLSEFRGRIVLINFWATWCGPCRIEMPLIESRFQKFAPELVVLAVNFDEPREEVETFVDEVAITFAVLLDPGGDIQKKYRVRGYPTTFVVDENGIIQVEHIGVMTESQLDGYLREVDLLP